MATATLQRPANKEPVKQEPSTKELYDRLIALLSSNMGGKLLGLTKRMPRENEAMPGVALNGQQLVELTFVIKT